MQQQEIQHFLEQFFEATNCEITEKTRGYLTVQLTVDLDKELMNRPFYWHYLEKTGGKPEPAKITFITDQNATPKNVKGEPIHFGSPRLHQIFSTTRKLGKYIRLYEDVAPTGNMQVPLYPWLGVNVKISYQCDRKKDRFRSIGIQLINGKMVESFHDKLLTLRLTPKIPDYSFTISPLIMPKSGLGRIENFIKKEIEQEDHKWAREAEKRWENDLRLLDHFYEGEEKGESYEIEKNALQELYEPKVTISIINGGLFYLSDNA